MPWCRETTLLFLCVFEALWVPYGQADCMSYPVMQYPGLEQYEPVPLTDLATRRHLVFQVKGERDFLLGLSSNSSYNNDSNNNNNNNSSNNSNGLYSDQVQIALDLNDTFQQIAMCRFNSLDCTDIFSMLSNELSPTEFRSFWVSWDNDNVLVGKGRRLGWERLMEAVFPAGSLHVQTVLVAGRGYAFEVIFEAPMPDEFCANTARETSVVSLNTTLETSVVSSTNQLATNISPSVPEADGYLSSTADNSTVVSSISPTRESNSDPTTHRVSQSLFATSNVSFVENQKVETTSNDSLPINSTTLNSVSDASGNIDDMKVAIVNPEYPEHSQPVAAINNSKSDLRPINLRYHKTTVRSSKPISGYSSLAPNDVKNDTINQFWSHEVMTQTKVNDKSTNAPLSDGSSVHQIVNASMNNTTDTQNITNTSPGTVSTLSEYKPTRSLDTVITNDNAVTAVNEWSSTSSRSTDAIALTSKPGKETASQARDSATSWPSEAPTFSDTPVHVTDRTVSSPAHSSGGIGTWTSSAHSSTTSPVTRRPQTTKQQRWCQCVPVKAKVTIVPPPSLELALDVMPPSNVSAVIRRRTSAMDDRPSSQVIGVTGVILSLVPIVLIVLTDVMKGSVLWTT